MEDNHSPTPTDNSIPVNDDLSKSSAQKKHKKGLQGWLRFLKRLQQSWLLVSIGVGLTILAAAIGFAIVDSTFRQNVFFPILDSIIASTVVLAIVSLIGYLKDKGEKRSTK